jgi:hypothetical protein
VEFSTAAISGLEKVPLFDSEAPADGRPTGDRQGIPPWGQKAGAVAAALAFAVLIKSTSGIFIVNFVVWQKIE